MTPATTLPTAMQLRICATVASSCSPKILSGLFRNSDDCGAIIAISADAATVSRAMCSLRAASRNVHQVGMDFWPGRSMRASGSSPASTASARARSWYGSDRILTSLVTQDDYNCGMMGVARKRGYHQLDGQRGVI